MAFDRILSFVLRAAELAFAAIVAGILGHFLDHSAASAWDNGRHIYTITVSALAMLLALLWLLPFSSAFVHWPVDLFISILWFVAFGLLVDLTGSGCGGIFDWSNITVRGNDACGRFKAVIAFAFLSAICWLASAVIGFFWTRRRTNAVADRPVRQRRGWYRSRV
ncbi:membrane-associating domain-containing protein [Plectosphaerella plurivora]|uniref:Membrane-associating domain-containing protein n=1 Tax=Plectosphaerella plurivora TaxID=936078 RepID=A0A9P9AGE8_9PEZI|nr:membrane-associating domain-containing protein [Plectosphaerella plurivora]